jgi:hypothetical protein
MKRRQATLSENPYELLSYHTYHNRHRKYGHPKRLETVLVYLQYLCFKITSENPSTDHRGWPTKTISEGYHELVQ